MAKARAIVKRLKAVRNIRKITRTMELIATARFKKAMERALEAAAYTRKLAEIVSDVSASAQSQGAGGISHPLLETHPTESRQLLLVLTSNRGLCGGYNGGVARAAMNYLRSDSAKGLEVEVECSGKRGINFFKFQKLPLARTYLQFEDKPGFDQVDEIATRYIDLFISGKVDRILVAYTKFFSLARQTPVVETLLPVTQLQPEMATSGKAGAAAAAAAAEASGASVEYEYLPSPSEILTEIVPASFKARLFKCFLDSAVSEQVARRVAMKSATENADGMIRTLKMTYNRARQSQITSELSEIIGGAAALE